MWALFSPRLLLNYLYYGNTGGGGVKDNDVSSLLIVLQVHFSYLSGKMYDGWSLLEGFQTFVFSPEQVI